MAHMTTTAPVPHVAGSSPTEKHPDYLEHAPAWHRTRCMMKGADGIKEHAAEFLPPLPDHEDIRYAKERARYVTRAPVYPAAGRTLDALSGAVFRLDPAVKLPRRYAPRIFDADNRGTSLLGFSQQVVREVLSVGRFGILIDAPADADMGGAGPLAGKPYLSGYTTENIINWRYRSLGGQQVLDQVVLTEHAIVPAAFGSIMRRRIRVLELDDIEGYVIRLFEQGGDGEYHEIDRIVPKDWRGRRIERIPFVMVSAHESGDQIQRAPLLDLIDTNLSHVLVAADFASALFKISAPTLVLYGFPVDEAHMPVEMGKLLFMPTEAKAELLEYKGDGLSAMERQLDRLERHMGHLGARLLEQPKRAAETAETTRLKQHGETSVLASISRTVSDGIGAALKVACEWDGDTGEIAFELNQDFFDSTLEPQMLDALVRAFQAGTLPMDDLFWNMKRGETVRPELTVEEYREDLENHPMMLASRPAPLTLNADPDRDKGDRDKSDPTEDRKAERRGKAREAI